MDNDEIIKTSRESFNNMDLNLNKSFAKNKVSLSLGIKNIRLGPTLPVFISPNVLNVLVEKFDIKPITTVDADIENALAGK